MGERCGLRIGGERRDEVGSTGGLSDVWRGQSLGNKLKARLRRVDELGQRQDTKGRTTR